MRPYNDAYHPSTNNEGTATPRSVVKPGIVRTLAVLRRIIPSMASERNFTSARKRWIDKHPCAPWFTVRSMSRLLSVFISSRWGLFLASYSWIEIVIRVLVLMGRVSLVGMVVEISYSVMSVSTAPNIFNTRRSNYFMVTVHSKRMPFPTLHDKMPKPVARSIFFTL